MHTSSLKAEERTVNFHGAIPPYRNRRSSYHVNPQSSHRLQNSICAYSWSEWKQFVDRMDLQRLPTVANEYQPGELEDLDCDEGIFSFCDRNRLIPDPCSGEEEVSSGQMYA